MSERTADDVQKREYHAPSFSVTTFDQRLVMLSGETGTDPEAGQWGPIV